MSEQTAKELIEQSGCRVLKGSYPDFIVYNEDRHIYCFVQVKTGNNKLTANQSETFDLFNRLDLPIRVLRVDVPEDFENLLQELGVMKSKKSKSHLKPMERTTFDALAECDTLKQAAKRLGISEQQLRNRVSFFKQKLTAERAHINECVIQQNRSPLLRELFFPKKPFDLDALAQSFSFSGANLGVTCKALGLGVSSTPWTEERCLEQSKRMMGKQNAGGHHNNGRLGFRKK